MTRLEFVGEMSLVITRYLQGIIDVQGQGSSDEQNKYLANELSRVRELFAEMENWLRRELESASPDELTEVEPLLDKISPASMEIQ